VSDVRAAHDPGEVIDSCGNHASTRAYRR
jgi:hypothetical protein